MPGSPSSSGSGAAAALGAVCGLRTFTAPAVLAIRGRWGRGPIARILPAIAVGELLADKSPVVPARSAPASFLGRVASGAATGAAVGGVRGAGIGATGAAAATYASERLRSLLGQSSGVPDPALGAVEDALAAGVALLATRSVVRRAPAADGTPGAPADGLREAGAGDPAPAVSRPSAGDPPVTRRPLRPLAAATRGLVAAAIGTAAMTSFQTAYLKATGSEPSPAPGELGRRVVEGVLRRRVPRRRRPALNQIVHTLYGTGWGLPLGLVAGSLPRDRAPLTIGAVHGLVVWGVGLLALPALDLAPPPSRQPRAALAADLSMHLVYGAATGMAWAALAA